MTNDTQGIAPALTAEEWGIVEADRGYATEERADLLGRVDHAGRIAIHNWLLPDDDPRKITRARVEALRRCMEMARDADHAAGRGFDWYRDTYAESGILALESLLPPDTH